jgi:hypothetical protein
MKSMKIKIKINECQSKENKIPECISCNGPRRKPGLIVTALLDPFPIVYAIIN